MHGVHILTIINDLLYLGGKMIARFTTETLESVACVGCQKPIKSKMMAVLISYDLPKDVHENHDDISPRLIVAGNNLSVKFHGSLQREAVVRRKEIRCLEGCGVLSNRFQRRVPGNAGRGRKN